MFCCYIVSKLHSATIAEELGCGWSCLWGTRLIRPPGENGGNGWQHWHSLTSRWLLAWLGRHDARGLQTHAAFSSHSGPPATGAVDRSAFSTGGNLTKSYLKGGGGHWEQKNFMNQSHVLGCWQLRPLHLFHIQSGNIAQSQTVTWWCR